MATIILQHGNVYDLGATNGIYNAHSDTFDLGNCFVHRSETIYKDAQGATLKWYKLVRDGQPTKVWQDGIVPIIWGKVDYRLYEYIAELESDKYNWVQIGGLL